MDAGQKIKFKDNSSLSNIFRKGVAFVMGWLAILSLVSCSLPLINAGPGDGIGGGGSVETQLPSDFEQTLTAQIVPEPTRTPGKTIVIPTTIPTQAPPILYTTQSGDWLPALAKRFGVDPGEISPTDAGKIPQDGLIKPGQMLIIPHRLSQTTPSIQLQPDSEVVFSPSGLNFNIDDFVNHASGHLKNYQEYLVPGGMLSGAQVVMRVALEESIDPRLLLAIIEFQSHWISAQPENLAKTEYPVGFINLQSAGLYKQLNWAANKLEEGYYGWRSGNLTELSFIDGTTLRINPEVNAGTAAIQSLFAALYDNAGWNTSLYTPSGFPAVYEKLFGDPFLNANSSTPLLPPSLFQPVLELPFHSGFTWSFTGGPHGAWGSEAPRAALDFAPYSAATGCLVSPDWVFASAPGLVVRTGPGLVVVDLDGDGHEQTGWVIEYLHVSLDPYVPIHVGTWLNQDDPIGHPSCEGGVATGTHVHIARKYNGEWMLADGPIPFVLSGWRAHAGPRIYEGTLTNDNVTVTACTCADPGTHITRP